MKKKLVLSLGSNLGNRYAFLLRAIKEIEKSLDAKPVIAHFYETPPWGKENQPQFINTAIYCYTDIPILQCFNKIRTIEEEMGRLKTEKWGPRTIDIDLLFYEFSSILGSILGSIFLPKSLPRQVHRLRGPPFVLNVVFIKS